MLDIAMFFRTSFRNLRKSVGFSAVVVSVLALGIGANTALFSIIDKVLLHPFPFRSLDRLVEIEGLTVDGKKTGNAPAETDFFATHVHSFEQTAIWRWQNLVLTGVDSADSIFASAIRTRIHDIEPDQPVAEMKTMQTLVVDSAADVRFHTLLLEIFAGLALGLAIAGIFAVVSYSVSERTREIGIRGALGATPRDMARFVLGMAMRPVALGACIGTGGGLATTRVLQSELFETQAADPAIFAIVFTVLIATAVAAASIPVWRAARIDPAEVLRTE